MRDDLREAWDIVHWADTHIPVLQQRFITWQGRGPYKLVMESDPDNGEWELLTARLQRPVDPLITGDVGAIINAARTALDILMFTVLARHRVKPKGNTHFPITSVAADFLTAVNVMKSKQGISADEATAIEQTKAYRGGNHFLYPLHQLDIMRKHVRVLILEPAIESAHITIIDSHLYRDFRQMDDKTILYRLPARVFRPAKGNTLLTAQIFFDEPTLLPTKQPAIGVLRNFVFAVKAVIEGFP